MKRKILHAAMILMAGSLLAADSSPKDDIINASKKLAEESNYRWTTTVVMPGGDSDMHMKVETGGNTVEEVLKGDAAGLWTAFPDLMTNMPQSFKALTPKAADLAAATKELKRDGDALAGDLKEDAAKPLLTIGLRRGGDALSVNDAKGSVKFWIKDGLLSKYEFKVGGKVTFNGNKRDMDRTTTVEIKAVGSTKVEVPEGSKKKLDPPVPAK